MDVELYVDVELELELDVLVERDVDVDVDEDVDVDVVGEVEVDVGPTPAHIHTYGRYMRHVVHVRNIRVSFLHASSTSSTRE